MDRTLPRRPKHLLIQVPASEMNIHIQTCKRGAESWSASTRHPAAGRPGFGMAEPRMGNLAKLEKKGRTGRICNCGVSLRFFKVDGYFSTYSVTDSDMG